VICFNWEHGRISRRPGRQAYSGRSVGRANCCWPLAITVNPGISGPVGTHDHIFFSFQDFPVLKWGPLFLERRGLTTTGHSLFTGRDSRVHSLTGHFVHTRAHARTPHALALVLPEVLMRKSGSQEKHGWQFFRDTIFPVSEGNNMLSSHHILGAILFRDMMWCFHAAVVVKWNRLIS
jgi:hypothetical protein